jgi:hypothetical protein
MTISFARAISLGAAGVCSAAIALAATAAHAAPAKGDAGLLGDTIEARYLFPDLATTFTDLGEATVTDSTTPLFPDVLGGGQFSADVTDSQVVFTFNRASEFKTATFNGLEFTDLTRPFQLLGVDISTSVPGFLAADASRSGGNLFVNLQGISAAAGQQIILDVSAGGVPEPNSWALMLGGFVTIGALLRSVRQRDASRVASAK